MKNPILLVEDDVVFSKMLSRFLERNGYDVIGCYTLEEAQKNLNASLSMVFTDLRLPEREVFSNAYNINTTTNSQIC